jgi:O-antigen ligase
VRGFWNRDARKTAVLATAVAVAAGVAAGLGSVTALALVLSAMLAVLLFFIPNLGAALAITFSPMPAVLFLLTGELRIGEFAVVYGIIIAVVAVKLTMGEGSLSLPRLWLPMTVFLAVTTFSVMRAAPVISTDPVQIWTSGLARPVLYFSLVVLGTYFGREKRPPQIVAIFAVAVLFYSASMYLQRLGLFALHSPADFSVKQFGGLLVNGNGLAAFLAPYLAFLLAFVGSGGRRDPSWTWVALLVGIPALALTLSRSGILAFSVAVILWLAFLSKASISRRVLIIGLVCLEFLLVLLLPQVNQYWANYAKDYASGDVGALTQGRDLIYTGAARYLEDPSHLIVGGGLDDYTFHIKNYVDVTLNFAVHSFWLRTLTDTGIVGLISVLYLMGALVVFLGRLQRGSPDLGPMARGALLALAAIAVFNLTDDIAFASLTMGPFWFIIGFVQGRSEMGSVPSSDCMTGKALPTASTTEVDR